jgi:hypothetical protein
VHPLAVADSSQSKSNTNLSRSISLSILDVDGNEIALATTLMYPYRFIIPRDPTLIIPPMTPQNVTAFNTSSSFHHLLLFNLHYVYLDQSDYLTKAVHIEMRPNNHSLAYLVIFRFDQPPQLNSSLRHIDGFSLFCPASESILIMHAILSLLIRSKQ